MVWIRALLILYKPISVWEELAIKPVSAGLLIAGLLIPLSFITSAVHLSGQGLEVEIFAISIIVYVVAVVVSVTAGSYMAWRLAPRFLSQGNYIKALNLAAYSYVAVFISFIIASFHPQLEFVKLLGLYSLYLYWRGLPFLLNTPEDRKVGLTFISALIFLGTGYLVSVILNEILL